MWDVADVDRSICLKIIFRHGTRQTNTLRGAIMCVWYSTSWEILTHIRMKKIFISEDFLLETRCLQVTVRSDVSTSHLFMLNSGLASKLVMWQIMLEGPPTFRVMNVKEALWCQTLHIHHCERWNSNIQLEEQEEKQRFDWRGTLIKLIQNLIIFAVR